MPQKPSDEIAFSTDEIESSPSDIALGADEIAFDVGEIQQSAADDPVAVDLSRLNADRQAALDRAQQQFEDQRHRDLSELAGRVESQYQGPTNAPTAPARFAGPGLPSINPKTGQTMHPVPYGKGVLDLPVREGASRIIEGTPGTVKALSKLALMPLSDEEQKAGMASAHELIQGIFQISTPAVVAGAVVNPVGTGWALLKAALAAKFGEEVAKSVGASPEAQALAGDIGALASGMKSVDEFVTGDMVNAAAVAAKAARAKGAALSLAAKLSGSGYGTGDVPGYRAQTLFEEPMVARAAREEVLSRNAQLSAEAQEAIAHRGGVPEKGRRATVPPIEDIAVSPEAQARQADIVDAMRSRGDALTPEQQAIRESLSGVRGPIEPEADVAFAPEEVQTVVQEPTRATLKEMEPAPFEPEAPREAALPEKVREPEPVPEPDQVSFDVAEVEHPPVPPLAQDRERDRPEEATLMGVSVGLKDRQEIGGMRYELWRSSQTGEGVMRITDPDSGETVSMSKGPYPTISAKLYGEVQKAERMEREPRGGPDESVQEPIAAQVDARERTSDGEALGEGDAEREVATPAREEVPAIQEAVEAARAEVNTEPTEAQKEAGNYKKGHVTVRGLDITIENPVGSVRAGKTQDGEEWSVTMPADYGYLKRTTGADGDHVDVYIGPNHESKRVYVVDQIDPETGAFDEHKAILGTNSEKEARDLYAAGFSDRKGPQRIGAITRMGWDGFEEWAKSGDTTAPLGQLPARAGTRDEAAAEQPVAVAGAATTVAVNPERGSVEVSFSEKPDRAVLDKLKAAGFRWAKANKVWYRKATSQAGLVNVMMQAKTITGAEKAVAAEPPKKRNVAPTAPVSEETLRRNIAYAEKELQTETNATMRSRHETNLLRNKELLQKEYPSKAAQPVTLEVKSLQTGRTEEITLPAARVAKEKADGKTDDTGELPARTGGTAGGRGAGSERALGEVPAKDVREPEAEGGVVAGHGSEGRVLAERVRNDVADVPEPDVTLGGGGDHPSPVAVSPTGATHDPGHPALDFDLTPERIEAIVARGNVTRAKDNLDAIDLITKLKAEDRYATAAEQEVLAKYVGWGASDIAPFLESYPRQSWSKNERAIWERIRALSEAERAAMGKSRLNAHFTFDLYRPIWEALVRAGFNGGRVLEPAVGTGHAFGLMPPDVRVASTLSASELEPLTAAIAGYLYPSATVQAVGYEKAMIARGTQDLVISNVPFGDYGVDDALLPKEVTSRIHNYFFAKALEHVRPGGLVVFVTSRYTMDNVKFAGARSYLMDRADFVGAVRLPNTAFDKTAKTEVVTDLIVLRRREEGQEPAKDNDLFLRSIEHPSLAGRRGQRPYRSAWYAEHPEYILGAEALEGSMYSDSEYTVSATSADVLADLARGLESILPPGTYQRAARVGPKPTLVERGTYKAGEYRIGAKGKIEVVTSDGEAHDATPMRNGKPDAAAVKRIAGMVQVRDALRETVAAMGRREATDAEIAKAQRALTKRYDAFVKEHGELNAPLNKRLFSSDPESTNLLALERLEAKAQETERKDGSKILTVKYQVVGRSDIFTKRTINPPVEKTTVDTPKDALLASLGQFASIDWNYMAKLSGTPVKELRASLEADGLVFEQPDGSYVLGEEYLSGDVVTRLEDAKAANKKGRFAANIAALESVQPRPKTYDDIETGAVSVNLGAAWVNTSDYEGFVASQLGVGSGDVRVKVGATSTMVRWSVTPTYRASAAAAQHPLSVKYGGGVYTFLDMVGDALNLKLPQLGHYEGVGKDRRFVPEPEPTLAARANLEEVRSAWAKYVFDTEGVRDRVLHIYNTRYNRTVERTFDGSHMTYPGMATLYNAAGEPLQFHKHQNDGVWRILASGNTLLAHEVGAGKTFEMIAAAMEMRRTGRARKPMIVVPTYLLPQWRRDILTLYPNAKVAAFDEKDLESKKRQTAMARIAYGDWDIVLVPHSSFGLLRVSEERMIAMMEQWTRELTSLLDQMGKDDPNSKQAERQRAKIEDKVRKLRDRVKERSADEALVWEQLGVDALLIDEAHAFKNLFFYSKLENLRGLSRSESDRALDLFVKVQAINEQSNYRNLVLATATPLMNSMAEVYAMQRYLQPQTLRRNGFDNFDNWYAMFAHAGLAIEQQPDGTYKEVRRLRDFSNLQLLSRMMREVMDYVGWEDMPYLKLPKIAGGKIEIVQTDAHPMYPKLREWFSQRMQNIKDTPPRWDYRKQEYIAPARPHPLTGLPTGRQDNILTIMNDAKKAAVDVRLILGDAAADFPGSRINIAAKKMATIYKQEAKKKGVQLVFLDLGTPKDPGPLEFMRGVTVEDKTDGELKDEEDRIDEGDDVMADDDTGAFNLYDSLKAALVARGVPANEIAYIHQASTSAERLALFQAANEGKVRFVFASTDKGGVGMNIQTRLAAIHELDAPRAGRPGDLRQRMGRGIRQGNTYDHVQLVRYVTKGTTDEWLWGMLTTKDYQIRRFMKGEAMSMTEEDPSTMSLQEAQMRASGDPRTIELVELKGKLARLQAQAAAAERALAQAGADAQRSSHRIETVAKELADTKAWLKTWSSKRGDAFAMEVGGKAYTKQKDADAAILAQAAIVADKQPDRSVKVGSIGGLDILASHGSYHVTDKDGMVRVNTVTLRLDGSAFGAGDIKAVVMEAPEGSEPGRGMRPSAGVVNAYEDIQKRPTDLEARLREAEDTLARATRTIENPASVIETAKAAARKIDEIEGELKAEGIANEHARRDAKKAAAEAKSDTSVTLQATVIPGASELGEYVLEPAVKAVANAVRQDGKLFLSVFSPSHIGVAPYAADVIRPHNAAHDQRIARAGKLLEDVRKVMDGWARQEVIAFWDVMEGLEPVESLPRAHRQFVQLFKSLIERWTKTLIDEGLIENYIEHYFPHEWAQPSKEGMSLRNLFSRRPIQGRESFRKRRTIPTMREGLAMGLEPASWNPAVQMLRKITEMSRSLNARAMQKDLKKHGFEVYVPATKSKPEELEGWERVPEAALGTVYGPRVEEQAFGRVVAGHYYAPKEVVRLLTNYTSPGLYGRSVLMDAYKKLGNASTSLLLGWSSFHLWLIGIESMISKQAVAAEMLARGQGTEAAKKAIWIGPHGVIRDLMRGYKAVQEFYSRDADANDITGIIGQIIQGGGGFGWSNWEHEEAPKKFMTDIRKLVASVRRMEAGEAAKAGAKAGVHGALSLFELPTELIMNHWVPYLKVAAYLDMAEMELAALPDDATLAHKRSVLGAAWDAVDDRFGQLRYANLFWDNTFKQVLTGAFLSVGWQVGSLRAGFKAFGQIPRTGRWLKRKLEGGGGNGGSGGGKGTGPGAAEAPEGGFDRAPDGHLVQREFAWMLSLVITVVLIDAIYQHLRTGKMLGEDDKGKIDGELAFRDAFYPRDGTKDASGRENRRAFISYMKDYLAWPMHPVATLSHKLKPILHTLYVLVENEDFFGNAIVDEADPQMRRFIDRLKYAAESHEPIGWQNAREIAGGGASFKEMLKAWVVQQGTPFTPASAEWERSPVEQYLHDLMPPMHRSKEQAEQAAVRRDVREKMQSGDVAGAQKAAREGGLSQQSLRATQRTVRLGALRQAFQRASWSQAVHAMEIAKPEERSLLTGQFLQKFGRAMQASSAAKRKEVIEQRNRVMRLVRGAAAGTQS